MLSLCLRAKIFGILGLNSGHFYELAVCIEHITKFSLDGIKALAGGADE